MDSDRFEDSFVFKTDRPWPNYPLERAAIVGHTTPRSVRLWFRTGHTSEFAAVVYRLTSTMTPSRSTLSCVPIRPDELRNALPSPTFYNFAVDDGDMDTTHVVDLTKLRPATEYGYVLYDRKLERVLLGHNRLRSFKTPADGQEGSPFQFALLSCHKPYEVRRLFSKRTEVVGIDMWDYLDKVLTENSDEDPFVICCGDQCYTDGVSTLNIWKFLNRRMRREGDHLLPNQKTMLSWFRDIYRGYWGFDGVQRVFDRYPTYMVWDDHEIVDGWGSHYLKKTQPEHAPWWSVPRGIEQLLPELSAKELTVADGRKLIKRMYDAATKAYFEYQHSHNPCTVEGRFDYHFARPGCAFYILDGRGQRDIERPSFRVLGKDQFKRLASWAHELTPEESKFAFIVSAIPLLHFRAPLTKQERLAGIVDLDDDLRDSWEHELHEEERSKLLVELFALAKRGIKVAVLSGDVHISAAFSLSDSNGSTIYQITSSAITNGPSLLESSVLRAVADDEGRVGPYTFRRLEINAAESFSIVRVDPRGGTACIRMYDRKEWHTLEMWNGH